DGLIVIRMATDNFIGPNQLCVRSQNLACGREEDPNCYSAGNDRVEDRSPGKDDQKPGSHRGERDVNVTDVVNIGKTDRGVVASGLPQQPRYPPIGCGGGGPHIIGTTPWTGTGFR